MGKNIIRRIWRGFNDSGPQRTVIGFGQAGEYCDLFNAGFQSDGDTKRFLFTFGSHQLMSIGRIKIRIPISDWYLLSFYADVVEVDVPLLLSIDVMKVSIYGIERASLYNKATRVP